MKKFLQDIKHWEYLLHIFALVIYIGLIGPFLWSSESNIGVGLGILLLVILALWADLLYTNLFIRKRD